jgi:hypothetical protein
VTGLAGAATDRDLRPGNRLELAFHHRYSSSQGASQARPTNDTLHPRTVDR